MMEHASQSQNQPRFSGRVISLWLAATTLCCARLVQLAQIILWDNAGPSCCQPEQRGVVRLLIDARNYSETPDVPLEEFMEGPGVELLRLDAIDTSQAHSSAVCEWNTHSETNYYPQEMEYLYRCWSYWQHFPNATWILYRPATQHHRTPRGRQRHQRSMRFVYGLLDALKDKVHMTSDPSVLSLAARRRDDADFRMATPLHARSLAAVVQTSLNIPPRDFNESDTRQPVIAVLNRRPAAKRSLRNAESIAQQIERFLVHSKAGDQMTAQQAKVHIVHFENKSFRDQIQFFSQTDIIISPHGAQLTGVPFLPECGAVLEVFPERLVNHQYFGSLAEAAGLAQYSFSLGNATTLSVSKREKRMMQQAQLCPSVSAIADGVRQMIDHWRICRRRLLLEVESDAVSDSE